MSLYQTVKSAITVRQVGEMYGMEPDRHGMVCCPFHSDNHPSMMLNESADVGGAHRPPCSGKVRLIIYSPKVVGLTVRPATLLF